MKILDIYILRKFLVTYFFTVLLLIAVLIVIDLAEKVEDFNHPELTAWRILSEYYLNFIPYYTFMLSPLMIFIAAVFVTSKLATHAEIVAMLSAGINLRRILRPYFIGACVIALIVFFLINWVVPRSNRIRNNFENNYVRSKYYFNDRNVHIKIAPTLYVYLERYDNISHVGHRFTMEKIDGTNLLAKLEGSRIIWDKDKKKWTLPDYKVRQFQKNGNEKITYGSQLDTLINIRPEDFESKHRLYEQLTLPELNAHIALSRLRGADDIEIYLVEKYERFAYPFSILILTMMGVIMSSRKTRGGTGFQIAMGFVLAFTFILLLMISRSFARKGGIPPELSAWIPNAIFCVVGYYLYLRVPK